MSDTFDQDALALLCGSVLMLVFFAFVLESPGEQSRKSVCINYAIFQVTLVCMFLVKAWWVGWLA